MHTIGWVKVSVAGTVLTVGLFGAPANAALCRKCGDLVFIQSAGKCAECGEATASGAHKICAKCSAKLGQCEHCRAATARQDAAAVAQADEVMKVRKAQGAPIEKAKERLKQLKANMDAFELRIAPVLRNVEKPFYSLTLAVPASGVVDRNNPFVRRVQIGREQAEKILDQLSLDGFLGKAVASDTRKVYDRVSKEGYVLVVQGIANTMLDEDLGWDLSMLRRLDGLRKTMDGEAAKAMDLLLERMSGLRAEWETKAAAAAKENAESGVKGDPADAAGGTIVFDPASGMSVTFSVEGAGQTAILAKDRQGRMVWKSVVQKPVNSLTIQGSTVIAMPGAMQYDLATGKLLAIGGR